MAKGKSKPRKSKRSYAIVGATQKSSGGGRMSAIKKAALTEKHTLTALGAALVLGFAKRQGYQLPSLPMLTPAATYGLGAWALARYSGNQVASHAATGLLSVAAYELAAGTAKVGEDLAGDDAIVGEF